MTVISKENLDDVKMAAFLKRFRGWTPSSRHVEILPLLAWVLLLVVVVDRSVWRWCVLGPVGAAIAVATLIQFSRGNWTEVKMNALRGPGRSVIAVLFLGAFALATGGVDSPALPFLLPICIFVGTFAGPRLLVPVTVTSMLLVAAFGAVSAWGLIPDFMPAAFGGGPGLPQPTALLVSKVAVLEFMLVWSAIAAHGIRMMFRDVVGEVLDARDEILRANDAHAHELTALSGELAHELKNPLANVKGLAVLVGRDVQGKGAERLEVLKQEVLRMEDILQGFLTFSRPLSPLNTQAVDLKDLVGSVLALHEGMAQTKGVALELGSSGSVSLACDRRKVKQILINLVQNALEASPAGGAVELAIAGLPDGGARIEVSDRGAGLPPAVRAHLFEPGMTTKQRGSGLGLAISRGLARQHGGELLLDSRAGGGCTATLTLPATPAVLAAEVAA